MMKVSIGPVRPCIVPTTTTVTATVAARNWQLPLLVDSVGVAAETTTAVTGGTTTNMALNLGRKWMEYQGVRDWEGLLDPLDHKLRREIIRYGNFVEASYRSFDFDPSSPDYAECRYPEHSLLRNSGFPATGYRATKSLRATSGIKLPRWTEKAPGRIATQSSCIGYVAVCHDRSEIARLGRRDVVIALRGTATCLEWLENLRATLTRLPSATGDDVMVESGFLSLYTSGSDKCPSLQSSVREEITRILRIYGDEPLSITITGHSLGAALATLAAYDIKQTFKETAPLVTVISFGGPRVGNRSFRHVLEQQGTKVLRIVNSDDVVTKIPGFVIEEEEESNESGNNKTTKTNVVDFVNISGWIQKRVQQETRWAYADIGQELRLSNKDSPYLNWINMATCHDLKTYLHLVNRFVSSTCPFRVTARRMMNK